MGIVFQARDWELEWTVAIKVLSPRWWGGVKDPAGNTWWIATQQ